MKKAIIVIIGLVLVAGAIRYFSGGSAPAAGTSATSTSQASADDPYIQPAALVGSWRSSEDAKFTREFTADGTVTDRYEGDADATSVGSWNLFTSANPDPGLHAPLASGVTYLKIENQNEVLFFSVLKAAGETLELSYLDRGNTLSFTRVK